MATKPKNGKKGGKKLPSVKRLAGVQSLKTLQTQIPLTAGTRGA
jgi:hypothetical protein